MEYVSFEAVLQQNIVNFQSENGFIHLRHGIQIQIGIHRCCVVCEGPIVILFVSSITDRLSFNLSFSGRQLLMMQLRVATLLLCIVVLYANLCHGMLATLCLPNYQLMI
jgi:hypothetical protein